MSVLPVYTYGTSVLRKKAQRVTEVSDEIIKLIMDMFDTMRSASGIGLAANQIGSLHRVIIIDLSDVEEASQHGWDKPLTLINPEVISQDGKWKMEEGCLSIPDVRDEVERAETVNIRYHDTNLRDVQLEANGLLGRVILHEIDHLNGVLFLDRLSAGKRKLHKEKLKQIEHGEVEVSYPIVTAKVTV